jgi:death-on-curing protein
VASDKAPRYLSLAEILALHEAVMERTGQTPAPLPDEGRLDSAVQRPRTAAHYRDADIVEQAALLAVGIAQAKALLDGNTRTAFVALDAFLRLNGSWYDDDPIALAPQLEHIATRSDSLEAAIEQFVDWVRERIAVA